MQTMQRAQWQRHRCHATNGASVRDVTDDKEYAGSMCRWNKQANKQCIDLSGLVQCSTCGRCTCFDCLESLRAEVEKVVKQQGRLQLLELPAVSRLRSKAHLELRKRSFGGLPVQGGPCVWCEEHVPQGSSMCSKPVHALRRLGVPSATNYWDTPPDVDNSVQLRLTVTGVDQQLWDCGELEVDVSVESCYPLLLPDDVRSTFAAAHVDEAMRVKLWHDAPAQENCDGLVHSAADLRARFVIGQPLPRLLVHVADDVGMELQPEGSPASLQPKLSAEALSQGQVIDTADDAGVGLQPVGSPACWQPESSAEALSQDQVVSISNDSPEALAPDQVIKTANEAV